jgi:hypothetical protein
MNQIHPVGSRTRRPLRVAATAVLTALLALLVPVVAATPASAYGYYGGYDGYNGGSSDTSGGYTGSVVVFPVLNCVQTGSNGAYTAVLGYKNTSSATYTITGDYNVISPSTYNGRQPTVFKPGTYTGVFSVPVSSGTLYWTLGNTKLTISRTSTPACPAGTSLPADGNGTGVVGALAVAAVLGALVVRRARRRAAVPTQHQEPVDA